MNDIVKFWDDHGTKVLGVAVAIKDVIGVALAIDGLIPVTALKWFLLVNGVLGVLVLRRGFTNSAKADNGQNSGV